MRTNKAGEPTIPKKTWEVKGVVHRQLAADLLALKEAAGTLGEALLQPTIDRHLGLADACDDLASQVKKGRPRVAAKNQLTVLFPTLFPIQKAAPKKPGRPRQNDVGMDAQTYHFVELRRKELKERNVTKPTIKAAIESICEEMVNEAGLNSSEAKHHIKSMNSAYKRGKQARQKRLET